ncbi:hypothetical protein [Sphingomonas sp. LT1P40]|uniref:hypothetical protein n=1 Tax=Alteristakelama amylovorans TaxID=3096166 RepID=UPI002FC98B73
MFFSATTGGFYDPAVNTAIPTDAVRVTRHRHAELLAARSAGQRIVADAKGRPQIRPVKVTLDQHRAAAVRAVKDEARRRILAIASLERQANDNAALALAAGFIELSTEGLAARDRRVRINAIRAASNAIEAIITTMPASNLTAFDAAAHPLWPKDA